MSGRKMEHLQQRKMVCLTPGVLLKLLEGLDSMPPGAGSDDHKPTILQVISIVPAGTGSGLWPNKGYFLKVSNSSHSTYASLSGDDNDLIRRDNLQLGQFIYVDEMVAGDPMPSISGVRAIQGRHPFVGSPKDLRQMVFVSEDEEEPIIVDQTSRKPSGWEGGFGHQREDNRLCKISVCIKEEKVSVASRYIQKIWADGRKQQKAGGGNNYYDKNITSATEEVGKVRKLAEESVTAPASKGKTTAGKNKMWVEVPHNRGHTKKKRFSGKEHGAEAVVSTSTTTIRSEQTTSTAVKSKGKTPLKKTCRKSEAKDGVAGASEEGDHHDPPAPGKMQSCGTKADPKAASSCAITASWKSLPADVVKLGKEVLKRRNTASFAAALALEEAAAAESLVKRLSMLSSLQASSAIADTSLTLTKFFDLHHNLASVGKIGNPSGASLSGKENGDKGKATHKSSCTISIETQQRDKIEWRSGEGSKDLKELRTLLFKQSESWFLEFLEKALEPGQRQPTLVAGKMTATRKFRHHESARPSRISMSEMKSINDWLDGLLARRKEEAGSDFEQIEVTVERLKKKGYEYICSADVKILVDFVA